jgi:hypothetical protein
MLEPPPTRLKAGSGFWNPWGIGIEAGDSSGQNACDCGAQAQPQQQQAAGAGTFGLPVQLQGQLGQAGYAQLAAVLAQQAARQRQAQEAQLQQQVPSPFYACSCMD